MHYLKLKNGLTTITLLVLFSTGAVFSAWADGLGASLKWVEKEKINGANE